MKVLFSLTYYQPYTSGLIMYVKRLAEALVQRGHEVTVLTSRYDPALPVQEVLNGVMVRRLPVAFRISKGAMMLSYPQAAWQLVRSHDAVVLNLPDTFIEAFSLSFLCRLLRRRLIVIHHCDLSLPKGWFNRLTEQVVGLTNRFAALSADTLVSYTTDYAESRPLLRRHRHKLAACLPLIEIHVPEDGRTTRLRKTHAPNGEVLIGFAGRFAAEKGVQYLLDALPLIHRKYPSAKVLFAGEVEGVIGEKQYQRSLMSSLARLGEQWVFLGMLEPSEMSLFYAACEVLVLPSINHTESFGLVQVESMLCGTPVIASNLPGVRRPIQMSGMGVLIDPRDSRQLAEAVIRVLSDRDRYTRSRSEIQALFSPSQSVSRFEAILENREVEP